MFIIIVGVGNLGFFLARKLVQDKHRVVLIEEDKGRALEISHRLDALVVCADGTQPEILEEAGAEEADCVVALTGRDEKNLVISQIAKNKFKVRRTIAKTNDPQNLKVFYSLGVDVPIDTTTILTKIIEEEASYQDFISLLSFKKGRLALVKVNISPGAPSANKKIKDLRLPRDTVLLAILRQENVVIPRGDTSLLVNDEVVALTRITLEKEVLRALIGKV